VGRLIFVEGFPGAGKSTTAQFLARQLTRHGRLARWVYEEEVPNPFVPTPPFGEYQSWEQFADVRVARWRAFAAAASDHDVPFEDDPVADATTIATVTGRYSDGKREVTVETVEGRLVLRGILWASNVLLPVAPDVFDVESWPLRLSFAGDTAETIDTFRCSGPRLSWDDPSGVFRRIPGGRDGGPWPAISA